MALGGGTFTTQNKILPGSYINFVSAARASSMFGERGVVAVPLELDWGEKDKVFKVESADFIRNSMQIFGYAYTDDKLKNLREIFMYAKTVLVYRLNGEGVAASNDYATAKYPGVRGNSFKIVIRKNVDDETKFDVLTYLDSTVIDRQTVKTSTELVDNDFVVYNKTAELAETAGNNLSNGTNVASVTAANYQTFLNKIEQYSFNVLACPTSTEGVPALFVAFTKRMRDEMGVKFQTVVYNTAADYEGVINLVSTVSDTGADAASLVYWVAGAAAGCAINKSLTNTAYNGEYNVVTNETQSELEAALKVGKFIFHRVGDSVRVLEDISSLITFTTDKNADFGMNQTVRIVDQIGNDIAALFNTKYIGKIPNDATGRTSLWSDIVTHHRELERVQAIENFNAENVVVTAGNSKKSVVVTDIVTIVGCMEQLYMTVTVA